MNNKEPRLVSFILGGMHFEYDEEKNKKNIDKHGISFKSAARIFFDYDRIEFYDEENSEYEDRYDTIGDLSAGIVNASNNAEIIIGNNGRKMMIFYLLYILNVLKKNENGVDVEVTRLISARYATNFERGLYYGKY